MQIRHFILSRNGETSLRSYRSKRKLHVSSNVDVLSLLVVTTVFTRSEPLSSPSLARVTKNPCKDDIFTITFGSHPVSSYSLPSTPLL